jgi:hypothetical protein
MIAKPLSPEVPEDLPADVPPCADLIVPIAHPGHRDELAFNAGRLGLLH